MKDSTHKILKQIAPIIDAEITMKKIGKTRLTTSAQKKRLTIQVDRLFELSHSRPQLFIHLEKSGFEVYTNRSGIPKGISLANKKYSFRSLGLTKSRLQALDRREFRFAKDEHQRGKQVQQSELIKSQFGPRSAEDLKTRLKQMREALKRQRQDQPRAR